ncbi:potassium channel family protein [uncultured Clostridium sp.]|uniref:potassium channel family protein n=1 Tax=uncultured Clostridium sp. TaxID=59620 RepID=UPI0025F01EE5|nr:potassium channel family protein [uncultured Clostridium sp.]
MKDLEFTQNEKAEFIYDLIAGIMAVIAVFVIMIEFSDVVTEKEEYYINIINHCIYIIFAADYCIRMIISKNKKKFFINNIIDLIAIFPFGLFAHSKYISLFKIARVFTYFLRVIGNLREILFTNNFIYAFGITILIIFIASIGIYFIESPSNPNINTYGDSLWWSIVTVSTVGYGDITVLTQGGRIAACMLMFTGIGFLTMFTSTISTYFLNKHNKNMFFASINDLENDIDNTLDISKLSEEGKKNLISYYNYLYFKEKYRN